MANFNCTEMVPVYDLSFKNVSFDELYQLYADILLTRTNMMDVETALTEYVTRIIEPIGWNAVWKIPKHYNIQGEIQYPSNCHFLVEVQDVSLKKLQALVKVLRPLKHGDCQDEIDSTDGQFPLDSMDIHVPLVQLYPVRDEEGLFLGTAQAVHTVRFFYEHIWRPWDDEDDEENFVEKHLSTRLNLYYERVSGCLPEGVECRIHEILTEALEIHSRLEQLQSQMTMSDSEEELEEEDVRTCVKLRMCMESLQREMEILENPLLRNLVSKKDFTEKQSDKDEATIHVVCKRLTLGMIKSLPLEENDVLEMHCNFENAFARATCGDTILLFPGHYKVGPLSWLEKNLTIKGLGEERVTLEAGDGCGDLFLSCNTQSLRLSNLEIVPSSEMQVTVMVHGGRLNVDHCVLRGAKNALVILDAAEALLEDSEVTKSQGDGIQLRAGAKCTLSSCSINNCLGSAVKVDSHTKQNTGCTSLSVTGCSLLNNQRYAILAECPSDNIKPQDDVTLEVLQSIPFLELSVQSVSLSGNGITDFGLCLQDLPKVQEINTPVHIEENSKFLFSSLDKLKSLQLSDSEDYI